MIKMMRFIIAFLSFYAVTCIFYSPNLFGQTTAWVAPASADNLKNPIKNDANAILEGKKLFKQLCEICHGAKGKGDGIAGLSLKPKPANFTIAKIQQQTDGALYWKMTEGRAPMASYKEALTETQRWQLVNYIRTLKK